MTWKHLPVPGSPRTELSQPLECLELMVIVNFIFIYLFIYFIFYFWVGEGQALFFLSLNSYFLSHSRGAGEEGVGGCYKWQTRRMRLEVLRSLFQEKSSILYCTQNNIGWTCGIDGRWVLPSIFRVPNVFVFIVWE